MIKKNVCVCVCVCVSALAAAILVFSQPNSTYSNQLRKVMSSLLTSRIGPLGVMVNLKQKLKDHSSGHNFCFLASKFGILYLNKLTKILSKIIKIRPLEMGVYLKTEI